MKKIDLIQNSLEWLEWRKNGIGSSDISAVCNCSPYRTRTDVMREKLGFGVDFVNPAMLRGKAFENEAREAFNEENISFHKPLCVAHDDYPFFIASLDGYCEQSDSIIEIKIPGEKGWKLAEKAQIPNQYILQMQWQMIISKLLEITYVVYNPDLKKLITMICRQDLTLQRDMMEKAHQFYADLQEGRYEVPKKPSVQMCSFYNYHLQNMHSLKENIKLNQEQYEQLQKELLDTYGPTYTLMGEEYSLTRSERVNIDYKAAAEKYCPDLSQFKKKPSISWTLRKNKEGVVL
jgi:putative phage-type endonuclease